jgi:hypothetical protein
MYLGMAGEWSEKAAPSGILDAAWEAPIRTLAVPDAMLEALEQTGCFRIEDLIKARVGGYDKFPGLHAQGLDQIEQALNRYLAQVAQNWLLRMPGLENLKPILIPVPVLTLPLPRLSERAWSLLERQALRGASPTNNEVQTEENRKGKRWCIHRHVHADVHRNIHALSVFLDYFEEKSILFQESLERERLDLKTLVEHLMPDPAVPKLILDEKEVERTILLLRILARHASSWYLTEMEPRWPILVGLSCLVEPVVARSKPVRQILRERALAKRGKHYKELACAVLRQSRQPMHWSAIAEEACRLGGRTSFVTRSLQTCLTTHRDLFVHVKGGTYALVEWGYQTVKSYPEIIASVLRRANRALSSDLIFARVSAIRPIRRASLEMLLDMHPRFYRSIPGTFGLRAWLREPFSHIPEEFTERASSIRRVERARLQGFNVEKLIREDRLELPTPDAACTKQPAGNLPVIHNPHDI